MSMEKKKMVACVSIILVFCALSLMDPSFAGSNGNTAEAKNIQVTKSEVNLSKKKVSIIESNRKTISLKNTVKGKKVVWKVKNKKVAKVKAKKNKCIITAKKPGKTVVTAKYNKKTYKCKVVVKKMPTSVVNQTVDISGTGYVNASVFTTKDKITYTVSNPSLVRVVKVGTNTYRIYGVSGNTEGGTAEVTFCNGKKKVVYRVLIPPRSVAPETEETESEVAVPVIPGKETETDTESERETETESQSGNETEMNSNDCIIKFVGADSFDFNSYNINEDSRFGRLNFSIGSDFNSESAENVIVTNSDNVYTYSGTMSFDNGNRYFVVDIYGVVKGDYFVNIQYKDFTFKVEGKVLGTDEVQVQYEKDLDRMIEECNKELVINGTEITDTNLRTLINLGVWLVDNRDHAQTTKPGTDGELVGFNNKEGEEIDYRKVLLEESWQNTHCDGYSNIICDVARRLGLNAKATGTTAHTIAEVEIDGEKWRIDAGRTGLAGDRDVDIFRLNPYIDFYRLPKSSGGTWTIYYD